MITLCCRRRINSFLRNWRNKNVWTTNWLPGWRISKIIRGNLAVRLWVRMKLYTVMWKDKWDDWVRNRKSTLIDNLLNWKNHPSKNIKSFNSETLPIESKITNYLTFPQKSRRSSKKVPINSHSLLQKIWWSGLKIWLWRNTKADKWRRLMKQGLLGRQVKSSEWFYRISLPICCDDTL